MPSYAAGVLFALAYFPAMAGLPLVLAIYYQDGLGYTALQSGLGVTAYALGSAVGAPLAGRVVTRIGRPLLLVGLASFAVGAITLAVLAGHGAAALAPALFLMGAGSGAIITPNQALTLMQVDPVAGSTAGGVLQTAQRIGIAIGQAAIGATFFAALARGGYAHALRVGAGAALGFLAIATAISVDDLVRTRRRDTHLIGSSRCTAGSHATNAPQAARSTAAARMSRPACNSFSLTVSGGAIRKMPPMPGNWTMFRCRPRSRHSPVNAWPISSAGVLLFLSVTSSSPCRRPRPRTSPTMS